MELTDILYEVLRSTVRLIPYVVVAVGIILLSILLAKLINKAIRWVVRVSNLEDLVKELVPGGLRFSVATITIMIADIGIALLAITMIIRVFALATSGTYTELITYVTRVTSVVIMLLILMLALDILSKAVVFEKKVESLLFILMFFFGLSMIVDLTGLSPEIRSSLGWGIAIGVGLSLGIFTLWFLFSDVLEKRCSKTQQ
ncbi:MAG: hypothetical protein LM561_00315 [Desulfurococcaceae archaeon]|nr:hypothetical protein [Desulfurococcaceae archaeon]